VVLVGGVGELWQGDLDLGRRAVELLSQQDLGRRVAVEDFFYGALHVADLLADRRPAVLVVIGAARRGRPAGTVERRVVTPFGMTPEAAQRSMHDALTGFVSIDLLLEVSAAFDALPAETVVIEVEPATNMPSYELSPTCRPALTEALDLVRTEVRQALASLA
jgi:hydrogenase maturation protease